MVVLFIKNWFKSWAFWVWLLFISLLASDSESVPRLQSAEEKEKIKKKKKIIKKIIKVKKVKEDEKEDENKEEDVHIVYESPEIFVKEDDAFIVDEINNEEISIKEDLLLENEVESDNKIDETDLEIDDAGSKLRVEENAADESGELSDNRDEDEDDVHWIDVGRGTGLARYCGLQNLLDAEESNEKLLIVERRTPPLAVIPRREGGPLTLPRGMIIKSLSQEKDRLEEIPEEERQPSPRPGEQPLDNSDKIWAQLVARYSEESEKIQKIENRILLMDQSGKVTQQKAKDFTEENMTSREFSEEVGKRLQLYLEKVEENAENDTNADDDGTQEIEGDVIEDIDLLEGGKHKIFIMIEDDESNEDRDEIPIPDEFNISNSDLEIEEICEPKEQMKDDDDMLIIVDAEDTVEGKEADAKASNQENETSFETENDLVVYEPENMDLTSNLAKSLNVEQVNEKERVNDFSNQDIDDENVLSLLIKEEIYSVGITDEFKNDSFNDKINIEESSIEVKEESVVEIKESESNLEDTPVFTVTVKRKSKSVNADDSGIEDVSCMSDSVTENIFHDTKFVEADIPAVQEQVSDIISAHLERDTDDIPEVSFVLPEKKKHDVVKEKIETDEDTETSLALDAPPTSKESNSEIVNQNVKESQFKDKDLCSSLPKISYKEEETNIKDFRRSLPSLSEDIFRKSEENLIKLKLGNERRSSRDLWKMECEKLLLEEPDRVGIKTLEEEKGEDIFITRYEEFPEDYITHEEITDDATPDKPSFTSLQELSDVSVNTQLLLESIQDESLNVDERDNSSIITMDSDFEIVMPSDVTDKEIVDSSLQITEDFIDNSETVLSEELDLCNEADNVNICYSEDHIDSEDVEILANKLKDEELSESACEVVIGKERLDSQSESIPDSTQLFNVSDILTHSEQNLVARILAQKEEFEELSTETDDNFENEASSKEIEDTNLYVSDSLQDLASKDVLMVEDEQFNELTKDKENLLDDKDKLDDVNDTIKSMETEDKLADVEDVPDTNLSLKATGLDYSKSVKDSLTEKEIILELIRKERDPNSKEIIDESEVPDYLEDVKDLLVPRARRKKVKRRYDALSEILKVDESEYLPSKSTTLTENLLVDEDRASQFFRELTPENTGAISSKQDEFLLTEEEQRELEDIKKEQEAYRAAQRKELEKFLAMPSALTEQEQRELEEFLAEEETDKVAIAGSEARLEALLADVRKRLMESGMDLGDENMDQYMSLPIELTEEEENLLNEDEEKGRHDFETDEDYREYIKRRYLDELEEDRIRVEEEELEFGEYYDDEYDYEDEDYGAEYVESDYVVMTEDDEAKVTLKDEAVGSDEPMEFEDNKGKKGKKFFSIPGLRSRGSSRGSRASLDKPGSKDSSREGSVSGEAKEQQNKQTKKFFRFGSLSIKRKKKSNEYPECDPNFEVNNGFEDNVNAFVDFRDEKHVLDNEFKSKNIFNIMSILFIQTYGDPVVADIIRKKRMIILLKCLQKHNKYVEADSNIMEKLYIKNNEIGVDEWNNNVNNNDVEISIKIRNQLNNPHELLNGFASIKNGSCIENESSTCGVNNDENGISEISPADTKQSDVILLPLHEGNDWEVLERDDSKSPIISSEDGFVLVSEKHRDSTLLVNKDDFLSNSMNSNMEMNNGVNSGCPVPSEVSIFKDTAMSGEGGGLATSSANGGVSEEEELWPDDSKDGDEGDEFDRMEKEVIIEMEKENLEKKKKREGDKKGKKKRKKKGDSEKENKKTVYQTKEELYEKHVGPRIRSFDAAKMKTKFNKPKEPTQVSTDCRICGKQVFQMEKIVAEKASWHKNCFRCKECNKNLTLETYQSHEGTLYCKPHFKELFRPKAVIQDEAAERKDRQLRRPRMIVLESNPEALPDDVVRATSKPDYGLEELQQQTLNVKERFAVFENLSKEEEKPRPEPVSVRRSQSLMSKAARFLDGQEDGEFNDEEEEEEEDEEEEGEDEEGEEVVDGENEGEPVVKSRNKKKKERPMSFSGMGDLKAAWEQKQRREEMSQSRKEEITRFRQMLCAGKNMSLKEKFESGNFDDNENGEANPPKEEIKIEGKRAASNLKKRFEQGEPFILEDDDEEGEDEEGRPKRRDRIISEKHEVEEIFKEAETAKKARNVFKQIDSKVAKEGTAILRSQSFASNRENRHSMDASVLMHPPVPTGEVVKSDVKVEDYSVDTTDLASRFKFFLNYEKDKEREKEKSRKVFRITPPREGIDQVEEVDFSKAKMPKPCMAVNCAVCKLRRIQGPDEADMLGRDPNLIRCTDNYQDDIDCRNTRNILQMFKKMEMGEDEEEEEEGPKPLKRFTPPPGTEENDEESDEEYSDEEYSDEEEGEEEEGEADNAAKVRDELLQMLSARKAASLRAKFERWEAEVDQQNDMNKDKDDVEEGMPSLDTAKNLKAMFEHKAIEVAKPVASKPITQKVNRFVGGGGEKCVSCDKTVYVMEKLDIHGKVLHKHCFKCFKCNTQLSVGSFSFGGGNNMFCSTHYKQLFTEKGGSYDAFTEEKGKWTKKIEEMNGELKSHD